MEDPWAAGPSWTPAKPKSAVDAHDTDAPSRSPTFTPPPAGFEVSDPWGVPAGTKPLPGEEARPKSPIRTGTVEEPSWGAGDGTAGWEEGVKPPEPPENTEAADVDVVVGEDHEAAREDWGGADEPATANDEPEEDRTDLHAGQQRETATQDERELPARQVEVDLATPPRSPLPMTVDIPADIPTFPTFDAEPEQPFAAGLPDTTLPKSPSFGDDAFGGFSTGFASSDPWGSSADVGGGWGGVEDEVGLPRFGSGELRVDQADDESDQEGEGEGWGRVRPPVPMSREGSLTRDDKEEDWEEVQRRMRLQEARVPREKVEGLKDQWKEVVLGLVAEKLEALTDDEERALSNGVRKVEADSYETIRSLSLIPPDINIYPPVISSLVTHERHVYALSRPNPTPSTSLLTLSLARRPRRVDSLDADSPWLTRSKLGEPEAPPVEAPTLSPETTGSKWSFWRKPPPIERQLTTSGGGVLEVKSPTAPTFSRTSSDVKSSFGSKPASIRTNTSRPASPASSLPISFSENDFGHPAPSGLIDSTSASSISPAVAMAAGPSISPATTPAPTAAPSAVSRFFGRLGRNKTPVPSADGRVDNKDLELSADDFTFLSEVPSLSDPADRDVGDLLSMEPGRGEQMASLESMLSSKPAPLPAPLAPPPRSGPVSRTASGSGPGFVPRMKAPAPRAPTDMDLLGGLDFGDSLSSTGTSTPPPPPIQKSPPPGTTQSGGSMWDDFLAPAPTPPRTASSSSMDLGSPATLMGPPRAGSSQPVRPAAAGLSGMFALSPPPPPAPVAPSSVAPAALAPPSSEDFDDFGTPQNSSVARFDDFDFGSFETPASKRQSAAQIPHSSSASLKTPQNATAAQFDSFDFSSFEAPAKPAIVTPAPKRQTHQMRSSLDHTPTISLMTGASASKGKRWPAPPSPALPTLEPPPGSSPASSGAGFPFLSPPPPPGRATPTRGMDLLGEQGGAAVGNSPTAASAPPTQVQQNPLQGLLPAPTPPRVSSPLVPAGTALKKDATGSSQGGLSSADLSFFDSL